MSYNPDNPSPIFDDEGNIIEEPEPRFAVWLLEMEPGDEGWDDGHRYIVETLDEEQFFFASRERSDPFIIREGMYVVSIEEMNDLRDSGATY